MRRSIATLVTVLISAVMITGCGQQQMPHVYYINSKAEVVSQLEALAQIYTKETGVPVEITTAASGLNSQTLMAQLAKSDGPTMFNLAGYDQLAQFHQYVQPLEHTKVASLLNPEGKANALQANGHMYTIPYAAEYYGIIANASILRQYFAKSYAVTHSIDELYQYDNFADTVVSMQEHAKDLHIEGAFAAPGLDPSDDYRWVGHMIRVPLFYEMQNKQRYWDSTIQGKYLQQYKQFWDLMVANNPTKASMLPSIDYAQSTAEFAQAKVAFYPNGSWSYTDIRGGDVRDEDLVLLPYMMGIANEEHYAPFSIYDAGWAVNAKTSEENKKVTLDFIHWMLTSDEGRRVLSKDMGFAVPATSFDEPQFQPHNPIITSAMQQIRDGKIAPYSVPLPGQHYHDELVNALIGYTQGTGSWKQFEVSAVDVWHSDWEQISQSGTIIPPTQRKKA